ncbi:unnamed protein product [Acanthoscelides obtectus]|uniref:Uncharacterized protein n=1 Tax=Acanthoscelides obtectus TaxID=200917 RepID=A0A9P0P0T1_ACAOB|nr:unnamed protein product [Acanthoscelides obtectus]CAK1646982.1 hypothetical protein AOBTE_LOCUS14985 [Acanthoscelides obtectus]
MNDEAIIVNTIGCTLVALAIVVGYILQRDEFRDTYTEWKDEGIIVNSLGMTFVALAILIIYAVRSPSLSGDSAKVLANERL